MGPIWGPCGPHEPCYQGCSGNHVTYVNTNIPIKTQNWILNPQINRSVGHTKVPGKPGIDPHQLYWVVELMYIIYKFFLSEDWVSSNHPKVTGIYINKSSWLLQNPLRKLCRGSSTCLEYNSSMKTLALKIVRTGQNSQYWAYWWFIKFINSTSEWCHKG